MKCLALCFQPFSSLLALSVRCKRAKRISSTGSDIGGRLSESTFSWSRSSLRTSKLEATALERFLEFKAKMFFLLFAIPRYSRNFPGFFGRSSSNCSIGFIRVSSDGEMSSPTLHCWVASRYTGHGDFPIANMVSSQLVLGYAWYDTMLLNILGSNVV